eukprot:TRINITY_DN57512_c0_g1_i1.p1 TRINITY_DN57512_c0_g1~~TRINITY_DN57512_c0_g1_i1.p1  ORF type:complete len:486 (+),score=26.08 TRINITY_DN57512_c0_g1_i1:60-1517(+)
MPGTDRSRPAARVVRAQRPHHSTDAISVARSRKELQRLNQSRDSICYQLRQSTTVPRTPSSPKKQRFPVRSKLGCLAAPLSPKPPPKPIERKQYEALRDLFSAIDVDKTGYVEQSEFYDSISLIPNTRLRKELLDQKECLFNVLDLDMDGYITWMELLKNQFPTASEEDLVQTIHKFDGDSSEDEQLSTHVALPEIPLSDKERKDITDLWYRLMWKAKSDAQARAEMQALQEKQAGKPLVSLTPLRSINPSCPPTPTAANTMEKGAYSPNSAKRPASPSVASSTYDHTPPRSPGGSVSSPASSVYHFQVPGSPRVRHHDKSSTKSGKHPLTGGPRSSQSSSVSGFWNYAPQPPGKSPVLTLPPSLLKQSRQPVDPLNPPGLSLRDLQDKYCGLTGITEEDMDRLFLRYDLDGDGYLNCAEFVELVRNTTSDIDLRGFGSSARASSPKARRGWRRAAPIKPPPLWSYDPQNSSSYFSSFASALVSR